MLPQGLRGVDRSDLCVRCRVDGIALPVKDPLHAGDLGYDELDAKDRAVVEEIFVPILAGCAKRNDLRLDLLAAGLPKLAGSGHALLPPRSSSTRQLRRWSRRTYAPEIPVHSRV